MAERTGAFVHEKIFAALLFEKCPEPGLVSLHHHLDAVAGLEEEDTGEAVAGCCKELFLACEPEGFDRGDVGHVVADAGDHERDTGWFIHGRTSP